MSTYTLELNGHTLDVPLPGEVEIGELVHFLRPGVTVTAAFTAPDDKPAPKKKPAKRRAKASAAAAAKADDGKPDAEKPRTVLPVNDVDARVIEHLTLFTGDSVSSIASGTGIDLAVVKRSVKRLTDSGAIVATGNRRSVVYSLPAAPKANGTPEQQGTA